MNKLTVRVYRIHDSPAPHCWTLMFEPPPELSHHELVKQGWAVDGATAIYYLTPPVSVGDDQPPGVTLQEGQAALVERLEQAGYEARFEPHD